jgi:hypothetical protein
MQKVEVIAPMGVRIGSGQIVQVSDDQLKRRAGALEECRGGYLTKGPVMFKLGEVFGFGGEINKALLNALRPKKEAKAPAKKEA